ncbi:topoisomerase C-terminal repeat-containing protein [Myroides sp. 1354]|uniref:type IA DNA topoisomerase n=1 Tax=unclassified Myroides TaxID=2642485 RepID=UPI0025758E1A|nr:MULTISPECIES: type IA DNA topoisomerase [unclassified Myroides]MDM1044358.1 topoisomerase C-terminal repeat-containing protein [Myroides sp. R163-1]MDM1056233.1 topoisomerase C-terminal repeat-containing protein [Myroides sp. 1354]MDM1069411.1 topoisomerase C-terminal repeat-containing protein [Myroides sp. 1372]
MIVILAEKPSVAREIALLVGAKTKKDGFIEGNGYCITWAIGHLVSLAMPEDYGFQGFKREALPILPRSYLLVPRKVKKENKYTSDPGALKQLKVIDKLFKTCAEIIVATDAGREGELIFRYIYQYLNCDKPFKRLWISSLTEKAIKDGLQNLKDGSAFDGLFRAGHSRSRADWLVGVNASQALTVSMNDSVYSLGRVQTPTLSLICKRYLENTSFKKKLYYQIELVHQKEGILFKSLSTDKWEDKQKAEQALKLIDKQSEVKIQKVETKTIREESPLLFDLTSLQKRANELFGFSAEETLSITQSLYEKKFITYPRTSSKYIPEDLWAEVPNLLKVLSDDNRYSNFLLKVKMTRLNKKIVNDVKVTDHHGLLTTDRLPSAINAKEESIYHLIAQRVWESVFESCVKKQTEVTLNVLDYEFSFKSSSIIELGWREVRKELSSTDEIIIDLPELKQGENLKIKESIALEKSTRPKALYTESTLLSAMENASKEVEDKSLQNVIKDMGIGTAATRASIIETLLKRGYITRKAKSLVPTEKGLKVYEIVKDKLISDVLLTAKWESAFKDIEENKIDMEDFHRQIEDYTSEITAELLAIKPVTETDHLSCPKCKQHTLQLREKVVKCLEPDCNWILFIEVCGIKLFLDDITDLVQQGKTKLLKGLTSKVGKKFDAYLVLKEDCTTGFEFK